MNGTTGLALVVAAYLLGSVSFSYLIVKIKEVAKNRTSIKIRYGVTGDLASSQSVFAAIERRL